MTCEAWVGLDPPLSIDCELLAGHEGRHLGTMHGSIPDGSGGYQHTEVEIQWAQPSDGSICEGCGHPYRPEEHVYGVSKCCPDCTHLDGQRVDDA